MILKGIGKVYECLEKEVYELMVVIGSVLVFLYYFVELLIDVIIVYGVDEKIVKDLVI